jgi:hypothetical protein
LSDESDEQYIALESQFRNLSDIDKKKDFIDELITGLCDEDCFKRCFEITKDKYLCRFGLTKLLKLTRSEQKKILPTAQTISHRNKIICITEIFNGLVSYRTYLLQLPPKRRDKTYSERVYWSHPCFSEAIKKVHSIPGYRCSGIAKFVSNIELTAAIKNERIILSIIGDNHLVNFIESVSGFMMDLTKSPGFPMVIDYLDDIIRNIPSRFWKRVAKHSMAYTHGGQIEYTSSPDNSLESWTSTFSKLGKLLHSPIPIPLFESYITKSISYFVHRTVEHIVSLQPGALRTPLGAVPQRAHTDFSPDTYRKKFPGQVFIGFMPVTRDGMFLQVWNGPGEAKLLFIPHGKFLLLPGNTVHAGWMCTSPAHLNRRLHFYILVSKEPNELHRKENFYFENMNTYVDDDSIVKEELSLTYFNALLNLKNTLGI